MLFGISSVMRAQGSICIKVDDDTENLKWGENIEDQLWKINDVSLNEGSTCVVCWSELPYESLDISEYNLCDGLGTNYDNTFTVSESGTYSFTYSESNHTLTATRFDCDKPADNAIWIGVEDAAEDWNSFFSSFYDMETEFGFKEITYNETLGKYIATFTGPVTKIPYGAFNDCSILTSIVLPECVTIIDEEAFSRTSITSITIPESVESIGDYAFYNSSLTSIEIPKGVKSIGKAILGGCIDLASITVAADNECFDSRNDCNAIIETGTNMLVAACKNTDIPNTVTSIGKCAYQEIPLTSISIPESVESIVDGAFINFPLETIVIPESVTTIGESVFMSASLTNITIPSSVTSIGDGAFNYCESLASITMLSSTPPTLGENVWWGISESPKPTIYVPQGAKSAYEDPVNWGQWFTIEEKFANNEIWYTTSSGQALSGNPMGCTTNVYNDGKGILTFGSDVTSITAAAFAGSSVLTSITIPASVESIGNAAFASCTNLTSISFAEGSQLASFGSSVFTGCGLTSIEIPAQVTSIPNSLFSGLSTLQSVTFASDSQLKTIGDDAFSGCSSLATIELPATVTSIGKQAFSGCSTFTTFEIPTSVASIGASAFQGCTGLISMEIPAKVTTLLSGTFSNCTNLTSVTFAEGSLLESIGSTFANSGLVSIEIPAKVSTIASGTFHDCKKLESVTFAEGSQLTTFASEAFNICINLTTIDIPESVTTINNSAFSGCSKLADITVHWTDAGSIINPGTAFSGATQGAVLHVPFGTKSLYENADVWKDFFSMGGIIEMPFELNVSELGWASLYLPVAAVIPASAKVYYAASIQDDDVTLTEIKNVIPANTGVIVKTENGSIEFPVASGEVPALEGNLFKGLLEDKLCSSVADGEDGKTIYTLAGKDTDGVLLFQPFNTTSTLAAYKVYLPLAGSQQNIKFRIADEDNPTGINSFRSTNADNGKAVNLMGVPVDDSYKGIILKGGKKIIRF